MTDLEPLVAGGVDTHKDVHVAAVVDALGGVLATKSFPASASGYSALLIWMTSFGRIERVGVEGTGAYGAGLARHLELNDIAVREVNRPNRQARRSRGKNDEIDAIAAARVAMSNEELAFPKKRSAQVECMRLLLVPYRSFGETRTRMLNQLDALVVTAPEELREMLRNLSKNALVARCNGFRPTNDLDVTQTAKHAMKALAEQILSLQVQRLTIERQLLTLVLENNPSLLGARGVGIETAAVLLVAAGDNPGRLHSESAFAALCGVAPIDASSGKIVSHRLSRGGDRRANWALYVIALNRMAHDERTRRYVEAHPARSKKANLRCLKRFIAREVYSLIIDPQPVTDAAHFRVTRLQKRLTLVNAASALEVAPARLSEIERQVRFDTELASRYATWLNDQIAA